MIKVAFLFLSTGVALVVAVTLVVGIVWLAVAVPVLIATAAAYGLVSLRRSAAPRTEPRSVTGRRRPPARSGY